MKKNFIQPKNYLLRNYSEYKNKLRHLNQDYTLKQIDLSGSKGFNEFKSSKILTKNQFNKLKKFNPKKNLLILEEKLFPQKKALSEMSVETIWQDGKIYIF